MEKNNILYRFYCEGYDDAKKRRKPRYLSIKNATTYFQQDCMWAYDKGYQQGLLDLNFNKLKKN